jgi:hypothetical protein
MTDPRIISIASTIFALLGAFSLYTGVRRMRDARRAGQQIRWYKQTSLLTGIEYLLLTFVFLLSLASQQGYLAPGLRGLLAPVYFALLIPAAVIAGLVIRQSILSARTQSARQQAGPSATLTAPPRVLSKQEQEERAQRQRQRRKKAAVARRRRAGKA